MDFYSYYKERFGCGPNPYGSIAQCQRTVMEMVNNHLIPLRISTESATGYLAALYDFAGNGCAVSFPFRIVMCALNNAMERAYTAVENIDRERAKQAMEDMRADGLIPMYDPGDYEVQDVDLEGIEMDGVDDDPAINELHLCDKESEGSHSPRHIDGLDSELEDLSKFFLDFEHIESWGKARWAVFTTQIDMVINIAATDPAGVNSMAHLLIQIRENFDRIPVEAQEQALVAADRLVLAIRENMESLMDTLQDKRQINLVSESMDMDDWYGNRAAVQLPPEYAVTQTPDGNDRRWKKGRVGRELVELNFDHLDEWKLSQWAAFKIHMDKMTAAAETTADALGQPGQLLEDIRAHIGEIPQHYLDDVTQMVTQLVQAIAGRTSKALAEILRYWVQGDAEAGGAIILSFSCDEEEGSKGWKISDMYIPKLSMPAYPLLASLSQELLNRIQEDTPQTEQDLEILIQHHLDSAELCRSQVQKISSAPQKNRTSFLIFATKPVK